MRGLNPCLSEMWFKMVSDRELLGDIFPGGVVHQHRHAYQYEVLPFGYALAPHAFP